MMDVIRMGMMIVYMFMTRQTGRSAAATGKPRSVLGLQDGIWPLGRQHFPVMNMHTWCVQLMHGIRAGERDGQC